MHFAYAEMAAVLAELARHYTIATPPATAMAWVDFPVKRPENGLPFALAPRQAAAAGAGRA
jgi:cytochrome P450